MFKTQFGKALDEETFESWLEKGRSSNVGYHYLVILWSPVEEEYQPAYVETRAALSEYQDRIDMQEVLVAIYDLYSESRITMG